MSRSRRTAVGIIAATAFALGCDDGLTAPGTDDPVHGTITAIVIHHGNPAVLVEERPTEADRGQKIFFHLSEGTEIFIDLPSDLLVSGSVLDLTVGATVRAWKGPVETLSYPGATTAPRIEVVR